MLLHGLRCFFNPSQMTLDNNSGNNKSIFSSQKVNILKREGLHLKTLLFTIWSKVCGRSCPHAVVDFRSGVAFHGLGSDL